MATGKDHDQLLLFDPRTGEIWERNRKARWQPHTIFAGGKSVNFLPF